MKRYLLPIIGIFVVGCMASNGLQYEAMSETNQYHLARVRKGMSQRQVLYIMHKPYSYESFEAEDDIYDVWFYVTRATGLDQTRMVPQNLTPLTFKNGILVGTGYSWYYYAMKEQAGEVAAQKIPVEKQQTHESEDKTFEKTLRSIPVENKTPTDKKGSKEEKLPPNVHVISKTEINYVPEALSGCAVCDDVVISPSCQSPCGLCPEKPCGPDRFSVLSRGMTESQVFGVFGEPIEHKTFELCHDTYDVWFYDTIPSKTGRKSIVPQHQTVLTFKNAVLISLDDETFYDLKKQSELSEPQVAAVNEPELGSRESKKWPSAFKPYVHKGPPLGITSQKEISSLKKGMSEAEVMKRLGVTADQDTFMIGDDVYNIWFYDVTKKKKKASYTIPLTFKNGLLYGTTAKEYNQVKAQVTVPCKDCYDKKGERMQEDASEQNFNYW